MLTRWTLEYSRGEGAVVMVDCTPPADALGALAACVDRLPARPGAYAELRRNGHLCSRWAGGEWELSAAEGPAREATHD